MARTSSLALAQLDHRPWPQPASPWVMAQSWHDLLFAHWPISPHLLRPLVPSILEMDTFDGMGWIGVVPFRMSGVRPRGLPAVPWLSAFPELNVRTYVRHPSPPHRPGVYFFSLDAANPVAVAIARAVFHLPYFRAEMSITAQGEDVVYRSTRTHGGVPVGQFTGVYGPSGPVYAAQPGTLDHWLTERYCLYAVSPFHSQPPTGRWDLWRSEIHHAPWPLQPAHAHFDVNTVAQSLGVPLADGPPLLHFARRIDVVVWPPGRVRG